MPGGSARRSPSARGGCSPASRRAGASSPARASGRSTPSRTARAPSTSPARTTSGSTARASCLAAGVDFVRRTLGVMPQAGGEHARMGTHNALLRLGDSAYLEVIAPNPGAPKPQRPRWFGLDELAADAPPRLTTWAVRSPDIRAPVEAAEEALGTVEPMTSGDL